MKIKPWMKICATALLFGTIGFLCLGGAIVGILAGIIAIFGGDTGGVWRFFYPGNLDAAIMRTSILGGITGLILGAIFQLAYDAIRRRH
jgi:hypothetical protein